MPTLGWGHSQYWQTQTPPAPELPGASASGGYIAWQAHVVGFCMWVIVLVRGVRF